MGGPYRGKLVEFGETVLAHLPERDLEIPHRSWQTDGNLPCGWARATSRTNTLFEQTTESYMLEVYDILQNTAGQKENLRSVVETPQKPRSTATDDAADLRAVPEVREHDNENEEKNEDDSENEKPPDKPEDDDHDMQGEMLTEPDTTTTTSSGRGEKRPETQENVFTKKRVMMKSPKRPITPVPSSEDPVK